MEKIAIDPVSERGGRTRYYYEINHDGISALEKILNIHSSIWRGIQDLSFDKKAK